MMVSTNFKPRVSRISRRLEGILNHPEKVLYSKGILSTKGLCLPDFLIIGAQKAGTTWLRENLSCHPNIFFPYLEHRSDPTEVRYFDQRYFRSIRYYSELFRDGKDALKGDKSPNYCTLPVDRIRFINKIMPSVKIIIMMRNPIHRAWSHAIMNLVRLSNRAYEQIDESEFYSHFDRTKVRGNYSLILEKWESVFPASQIYTGFFDDIITEPPELLSEIFDFLGVPQSLPWKAFPFSKIVNRGSGIRMPKNFRNYLENMYCEEIQTLQLRFGPPTDKWSG